MRSAVSPFVSTLCRQHVSTVLDAQTIGARLSTYDNDERATMGRLFDLIEEHRDMHRPYAPSYKQIAERVGVSRQTLLNWRDPTNLPTRDHLDRLAEATGVPYLRVLDAALHDAGYLPAKSQDTADQVTKRPATRAESRTRRADPVLPKRRNIVRPDGQ